jgi:tRNA threonylcarbamoyladenosine biosynthesis protein TsaB
MTVRMLLLETSQQPGVVAVAEGGRLCAVCRLDEARRHARDLAPAVVALLAGQGWRPRDLHAVVVGRGPGSYTGLRVGHMSAKAFAYATGCALIALDSFAVIAAQAPGDLSRLGVLADAQQDKVYVQEFERGLPLGALTIQAWPAWLAAHAEPMAVCGPGLRKWVVHLPAWLRPIEVGLWDPLPQTMLRLGMERYLRGERDDLWKLEPLYLRPSSAEEQWLTRGRA